MSQALTNLTTAIDKLATTIDNAVAVISHPTPPAEGVPEADVQAAADKVVALNASLDAALHSAPPTT